MATKAIDAIDYWREAAPEQTLACLSRILPLLNDYLAIRIDRGVLNADDEDEEEVRSASRCQCVRSLLLAGKRGIVEAASAREDYSSPWHVRRP